MSTTLSSLAEHFCLEFSCANVQPSDIVKLFECDAFSIALSSSESAHGLVKCMHGDKTLREDATAMALGVLLQTSPDAYVKLRSMNLTEQLMNAMPSGVRDSINKMASQLLASMAPPADVAQTPCDDAVVQRHVESAATDAAPVQPANMIANLMKSGLFQEMTEMMTAEMDDQHGLSDTIATMDQKMSILEQKMSLLHDRVDRIEKRSRRGGKHN
jgi:hypothetical protein